MRLNQGVLSLNNKKYIILSKVMENISCCDLDNKELTREVIVKIELERIDM